MDNLTGSGNYYTCMKCGTFYAILSNEPELKNFRCSCGTEPVTVKIGKLKITKAAPQNVVPQPKAEVKTVNKLPSPPVTFNPSATVGTIVAKQEEAKK